MNTTKKQSVRAHAIAGFCGRLDDEQSSLPHCARPLQCRSWGVQGPPARDHGGEVHEGQGSMRMSQTRFRNLRQVFEGQDGDDELKKWVRCS